MQAIDELSEKIFMLWDALFLWERALWDMSWICFLRYFSFMPHVQDLEAVAALFTGWV